MTSDTQLPEPVQWQPLLPCTLPEDKVWEQARLPEGLRIQSWGRMAYQPIWQAMVSYTQQRDHRSVDALWVGEHDPVYTLGMAGKTAHIIAPGDIPVIRSDRGGQVSYHGPGQLVVYPLIDLSRYGLHVRPYVHLLEQVVIDCLMTEGIFAERCPGAPGVYVAGAKIAALGLRIRRHCSYHGLALNVDMDLAPYRGIHPCGRPFQTVTCLSALGVSRSCADLAPWLCGRIVTRLRQAALRFQRVA